MPCTRPADTGRMNATSSASPSRLSRLRRWRPSRPSRRTGTVLGAVAAALLALWLLWDWNWFKGPLERAVSGATGREFRIDGDLDVDLGRTITVSAEGLRLANADWSKQARMGQADRVEIDIAPWPLLALRLLALSGLLGCLLFWLRTALGIGQAILGAAVAHQVAQVADAHASHLMHTDQQRSTDRQAVMANLADHRRSDLEHARQRGVVLQLHLAQQDVQ